MCSLGTFYANEGVGGRAKYLSQACKWFRIAAETGCVGRMAAAGSYFIEKNTSEGMSLLNMAAKRGKFLFLVNLGCGIPWADPGCPKIRNVQSFGSKDY